MIGSQLSALPLLQSDFWHCFQTLTMWPCWKGCPHYHCFIFPYFILFYMYLAWHVLCSFQSSLTPACFSTRIHIILLGLMGLPDHNPHSLWFPFQNRDMWVVRQQNHLVVVRSTVVLIVSDKLTISTGRFPQFVFKLNLVPETEFAKLQQSKRVCIEWILSQQLGCFWKCGSFIC